MKYCDACACVHLTVRATRMRSVNDGKRNSWRSTSWVDHRGSAIEVLSNFSADDGLAA